MVRYQYNKAKFPVKREEEIRALGPTLSFANLKAVRDGILADKTLPKYAPKSAGRINPADGSVWWSKLLRASKVRAISFGFVDGEGAETVVHGRQFAVPNPANPNGRYAWQDWQWKHWRDRPNPLPNPFMWHEADGQPGTSNLDLYAENAIVNTGNRSIARVSAPGELTVTVEFAESRLLELGRLIMARMSPEEPA
jgi:hypothetical protein